MYAEMRSKKLLTYEECIRFFDTEQGDAWCEAVYNEDSWYKYVRPLLDEGNGSYLYAAQGSRKMHRRWWLYNRFKYMDSKYIAGDYKNDFATLRLYTPSEWEGLEPNADMTITSYAGQYVNVQYGSYTVGTRSQKNVPVHIKAPAIQFNDTETIIFGAGQISSLGDLSSLYPGSVDVSKMTKLVELIIGSGAEGYRNTNMEVLSVGANHLLRKLDIRNCPNLKQAIDLALCSNIREIWAEGTGTSAVVLPEGGNLTMLHLPDTITNLTVRNQTELTDAGLVLAGVQNLSTIRWENTNKANVLSVIDRCLALDEPKLVRIRITELDSWSDTLDSLVAISGLMGIDENGNNIPSPVITGKLHVRQATERALDIVHKSFPQLSVTYDELFVPDGYSITITGDSTVYEGKTLQLTGKSSSSNYPEIIWSIPAYGELLEDAISIDDTGLVTAKLDPSNVSYSKTFTVRCTSIYNPRIRTEKTITVKGIAITGLTITGNNIMSVNDIQQLALAISPEDATKDRSVVWESSDITVLTVDAGGYVKDVYDGEEYKSAVITARLKIDGSISKEFTITAKDIVIITAAANAPVMSVVYENGWSKTDTEMYASEAMKVEHISGYFKNNQNLLSFEEFKYFTSVTSLSSGFSGCSALVSIAIPKSITKMEDFSFNECRKLKTVFLLSQIPPTIYSNTFYGTNCTFIVPKGSLEAYRTATNWSSLASRIKESEE